MSSVSMACNIPFVEAWRVHLGELPPSLKPWLYEGDGPTSLTLQQSHDDLFEVLHRLQNPSSALVGNTLWFLQILEDQVQQVTTVLLNTCGGLEELVKYGLDHYHNASCDHTVSEIRELLYSLAKLFDDAVHRVEDLLHMFTDGTATFCHRTLLKSWTQSALWRQRLVRRSSSAPTLTRKR